MGQTREAIAGKRIVGQMNRSVLRAISLLKAFQGEDEWVSASEISRRAALPFASTHRLLQTLEQTGAVDKGEGGCYRLGYLIASLSQNVDIDDCLHRASRDLMSGLAQRLGVTVFLGRLDGKAVNLIGRAFAPSSKHKFVAVGSRFAAQALPLGRVLLSDLPLEEIDRVVQDHPASSSSAKSDLVAELALVRSQGFAVGQDQPYPGFGSVAVPVRDDEGRIVAALSASDELARLMPDRIALIRMELLGAAPALRRKILPDSSRAKLRPIQPGFGRTAGSSHRIDPSQIDAKVIPLKRVVF